MLTWIPTAPSRSKGVMDKSNALHELELESSRIVAGQRACCHFAKVFSRIQRWQVDHVENCKFNSGCKSDLWLKQEDLVGAAIIGICIQCNAIKELKKLKRCRLRRRHTTSNSCMCSEHRKHEALLTIAGHNNLETNLNCTWILEKCKAMQSYTELRSC